MRTIAILFLMLLFQFVPAKNKSKKKTSTHDANVNSILWQITGNKLPNASYLFGTVHAIPNDDYFMGKNILKKLKEAEQLVMELDLTEVNEAKLANLSLLPENINIKDFISNDDYNKLEDFLIQKYGMNKAIFENVYTKLKPFYIEQFVLLSIIGDNKKIYENELNDIASDFGKNKIGLEKLEEQLAAIDSIPLHLQYKNLIENLNKYDEQVEQYKKLISAYKKQDIHFMYQQFEEHFEGEMNIYKKILLDDRNTKWIPRIIQLISNKSSFIAVGAGHLAGENGLIKLLQNEGYTVVPIQTN